MVLFVEKFIVFRNVDNKNTSVSLELLYISRLKFTSLKMALSIAFDAMIEIAKRPSDY